MRERPDIVLYGFAPMHEARNVATADWLRGIALSARTAIAAVPFVTIDAEGGLVEHPPSRYPTWPFRR